MNANESKAEALDRRIARIKRLIDRERQNLQDSGFIEHTPEFNDLYREIVFGHFCDILPLAVERHKILAYSGAELSTLDDFSLILCGCPFYQLESAKEARQLIALTRPSQNPPSTQSAKRLLGPHHQGNRQ